MHSHRNDSSTVNRRGFITGTSAAGATLLAGCTDILGSGGSSGESNTLSINWFTGQATDKNIQAFKDAVAAFEEKTGKKVDINGISQAGQIINKTQTAVQSGSPPNLALIPAGGIIKMAAKDMLEPIGDRINSAKTFDRSDIVRKRKFDISSSGGKTFGLPVMSGHWGSLYYNSRMLEKAGYDPKKPDFKTFPKFLDVARDVKDAVGVKPIGLSGADHIQTTVQWSGFYHTTGEDSWLNKDQSDTLLNKQPGIDTAKFTETAVKDGLVPDGVVNMNGINLRELFKSKQIFAYQTGSWEKAILDEQSDINYGITWNPQHPDGRPSGFSGGWFFTIPKGADQQDQTWKLVEHLMKLKHINKYAQLPPILTDGLERTFKGFKDGLGREVGDIFVKEIKNAAFPTIHKNQSKMWSAQRKQYQHILLGNKSAEQAMSDLGDQIQSLI